MAMMLVCGNIYDGRAEVAAGLLLDTERLR
jgi:hypothetical protein